MNVGLIPFRKGSKRIPNKALKKLGGLPLVSYTMLAAHNSNLDLVILATDYEKLKIRKLYTIFNFVVYQRENVSDDEPATEYIEQVIEHYELKDTDNIILLQPTCPFRCITDINSVIEMFNSHLYNTIISVVEIDSLNKLYINNKSLTGNTSYEKNDKIYMRNSSIYMFNVGFFMAHNTIFEKEPGLFVMPSFKSIDIDTVEDWEHAEMLIEGGVLDGSF